MGFNYRIFCFELFSDPAVDAGCPGLLNSELHDRQRSCLISPAGIEDVAEAFPEEVVPHDSEKDGKPGIKG